MSKTTRVLFAAVACAFVVTQATAQDAAAPSVSLGGGLRAGASWGDGDDNYGLNNVRLYLNASAYGWLGVEVNTETSLANGGTGAGGESSVIILDAVAKVTLSDTFNVWAGRFLAPSDRANLSGPYYGNIGNSGLAGGSPFYMGGNGNHGRDDGLAVWGNIGGAMNLKYQLGIFDGAEADDQMIAGRLVLNLWDDEPGYYNASTYYGEKQILAIGIHFQDGAGSAGGLEVVDGLGNSLGIPGDSVGIDLLVEKTLDAGTVTLEASYVDADMVTEHPISVFVGLLLNNDVAIGPMSGKPRPYIRYVKDSLLGPLGTDELSFGAQYVIDGHKANITLEYTNYDWDGDDVSTYGIGAQFQF